MIPPTRKKWDVEFGQTTKWDGDQLIVISAFWDAALLRNQIGLLWQACFKGGTDAWSGRGRWRI